MSKLQENADLMLKLLLRKCRRYPELQERGPSRDRRWTASVAVVGTREMVRLNRKFRRKASPTDVLSFPAPNVFFEEGVLGDLVICAPVLRRQARQIGHSDVTELQVLLVHGLLHLLGFDHEASALQARQMREWEGRLLGAKRKNSALIARAASAKTKA